MAANDAARHALYSRLEDVLGRDHADTLMTHLPRDRSDDVATKGDLAVIREDIARLEARFEARFDRLEERMDRMQRFYVGTTVGSMTALTAIFTLANAFLG